MTSTSNCGPVRRRSALERLPNEIGVKILKRLPIFTQLKMGQVSRTCFNFRLLTTSLQKKLCINFTNNEYNSTYSSVVVPNSRHPTHNAYKLFVTDENGVKRPMFESHQSLVFNSGIIINIDSLEENDFEKKVNQLANIFPKLNEIIVLSYGTSLLELQFINLMIIQWSAGLEVLKVHLGIDEFNYDDIDHEWFLLLDKLQTLPLLKSVSLTFNEPILEKYQKERPQPNEPLFPMLAKLRELYLDTDDREDYVYSSVKHFAQHNPHLKRIGLAFLNEMHHANYAKLGQQISSRFIQLNTIFAMPCNQIESTVRSFPSLTDLQLQFNQKIEYMNTMALLVQLPNLMELYVGFTVAFETFEDEQASQVKPIESVKILSIKTYWREHGILEKLYIIEMFPNVQFLDLANLARNCNSMHCEKLANNLEDDEDAFMDCLKYYLDPVKALIKRLGKTQFECRYYNFEDSAAYYMSNYFKLLE